jgi:hypothetical protein
MPDNGAYEDRPAYGPQGRWTQLRTEHDEAITEVEQLRELARNLLVAWLNGWEPGENQDLIDAAEETLDA